MMNKHTSSIFISCLFLTIQSSLAVDFVINNFNSSNISLYSNATIESGILTLTNDTTFSIGRALYPSKILTKQQNSSIVIPFSTSFVFAMAPYRNRLPGHGIVFLFAPNTTVDPSTSAQNLGFLNRTVMGNPGNHVFGVEFDVFSNEEFSDINDNHVGIDVNSLSSIDSYEAGYWSDDSDGGSFRRVRLNNGRNYQVWIDYTDFVINVTLAPIGMKRPSRPLLNLSLNLSDVFEDEMYVGFTASTGGLVESHKILGWSFSNSNFSLSDELVTRGLPSFELSKTPVSRTKGFIAGLTVGLFFVVVGCCVVALCLVRRSRRKRREREEMEDWELEYWPHRMSYQEIEAATKGFSDENVIGIGGNGQVYKGVLPGGAEVAVKRLSHENSDGIREFLAEVSSLGRLKHRNLVGLKGWCKKSKGSFILVYEYMENGSLDKRIFECDEGKMLGCRERIKILKDVASGILYLHEGWEAKVLHRDIKSSNVLLDREMNARLSDFGLARMYDHSQVASTTRVVGTVGYLAPEVIKTGRASAQTDVFGYGILVLEVMCGQRPIEEGKPPLVDRVWELMKKGELDEAVDERIRVKGEYDEEEVERVMHLGLLCAHPDPHVRPTMRQVVKLFEGKAEVEESEREDMDAYLLEKVRSREIWPSYSQSSSHSSHPTFQEIRDALFSSTSLSWSSNVVEGPAIGENESPAVGASEADGAVL